MPLQSAGLLLYRRRHGGIEVFLVHLGGPMWAKKDLSAWSIPKGIIGAGEEPLEAAVREFFEETGSRVSGSYEPLGTIRQNSNKDLTVWALEGDFDPARLQSNHFKMEWPPKSGRIQQFPEADRGGWFDLATARQKMVKGQRPILERFIQGEQAQPRDVPC